MRKVFLDDLPKKNGYNGKIDWKKSIDHKVKFIYEDIEGWVKITGYQTKGQKLSIKYNDSKLIITTGHFQKCQLGKLLGKRTLDFKIEIGTRYKDEEGDITITDREYRPLYYDDGSIRQNDKWYKYHCNKCGWDEGWRIESLLLTNRKHGCACCDGKTLVLGINTIWDTDKWMIPIVGEEIAKTHTNCSNEKFEVKCPHCNRVKSNKMIIFNIYRRHSIGCSCSDNIPYPEKLMFSVLEQLGIDFETQLSKSTFNWCDKYRYDFYFTLNGIGYIVETHGIQHYEDRSRGRSLTEEKENDMLKKELALVNGIKEENYIVIDCRESELELIKNSILNSELRKVFDLSNIDWMKAEEFTCSNLLKTVCEIKRDNPSLSTTDIGNLMKLDRHTILRYLQKGSKIWDWCYYDVNEEMLKSSLNPKKQTEIFKDGISLGIFESVSELEKCSEELFGVKLAQANISAVCNGKRKTHKGFTFKYI